LMTISMPAILKPLKKEWMFENRKKTRPYITHLHNNDEKSRPLILRRLEIKKNNEHFIPGDTDPTAALIRDEIEVQKFSCRVGVSSQTMLDDIPSLNWSM